MLDCSPGLPRHGTQTNPERVRVAQQIVNPRAGVLVQGDVRPGLDELHIVAEDADAQEEDRLQS